MPINPKYFRLLCHRRMSPWHWAAQTIKTAYWLCRGGLTLRQAWRIWTGKARLVVHSPYDAMAEWGNGPH